MDVIENQTCPTVGYQAASVCVPVTVTPYANAGATMTKCCGGATVIPGRQVCSGIKNGACSFTLSQNICVAVPVDFGATASVGEAYVECLGASSENICADCNIVPVAEAIQPDGLKTE